MQTDDYYPWENSGQILRMFFALAMLSLKLKIGLHSLLKELIYFAQCWIFTGYLWKGPNDRLSKLQSEFPSIYLAKSSLWTDFSLVTLAHMGEYSNSEEAWKWQIMRSGWKASLWLNFKSILFNLLTSLNLFRSTNICKKGENYFGEIKYFSGRYF